MHDLWRARVDAAIAKELLRAVEPAIEAASEAERAPAGPAAVTEPAAADVWASWSAACRRPRPPPAKTTSPPFYGLLTALIANPGRSISWPGPVSISNPAIDCPLPCIVPITTPPSNCPRTAHARLTVKMPETGSQSSLSSGSPPRRHWPERFRLPRTANRHSNHTRWPPYSAHRPLICDG
jgi:hypothetical protein